MLTDLHIISGNVEIFKTLPAKDKYSWKLDNMFIVNHKAEIEHHTCCCCMKLWYCAARFCSLCLICISAADFCASAWVSCCFNCSCDLNKIWLLFYRSMLMQKLEYKSWTCWEIEVQHKIDNIIKNEFRDKILISKWFDLFLSFAHLGIYAINFTSCLIS